MHKITLIHLFILLSQVIPFVAETPQANNMKVPKFVDYKAFGAKGDGKTNDFLAIIKAHDFANKNKLPVKVEGADTYYIGGNLLSAVIKTNTDFGNAKFIIDDTKFNTKTTHVFSVESELKRYELEGIKSLKKNQSNLNVTLKEAGIVQVTNSNVKIFKRKGKNVNSGSNKRDLFLVYKDSKVDPKTPITWDFKEITKIDFMPIDKKELLIQGGKFHTLAPNKKLKSYYKRGIAIRRSNVVVDGFQHTIQQDGKDGPPYLGFISIANCANVLVQNSLFTPHKTYFKIGNAGSRVAMGSYGLHINSALNVTIKNCSQSIDINNRKYWGLMASNFSKNLTYDNCKFSRFDAHQGVTNAKIINSTLGFMGIKAIGHGTLLLKNTTVQSRNFIDFRPDYGSTWNGNLIIKNCIFKPMNTRGNQLALFRGSNTGDHDFGYKCYLPNTIEIDGLIIDDKNLKSSSNPVIFTDFNRNFKTKDFIEKYPYVKTEKVILKDVTVKSGKKLDLSFNKVMFSSVKVLEK